MHRMTYASRDWTRVLLWAGGALALVALAPLGRRLVRGRSTGPQARRRQRERLRQLLHDAILGNTRHAVAAVFGPPRTALVAGPTRQPEQPPPNYFHADTWYYPLDLRDRIAMAVQFDQDTVKEVDFIRLTPTSRHAVGSR